MLQWGFGDGGSESAIFDTETHTDWLTEADHADGIRETVRPMSRTRTEDGTMWMMVPAPGSQLYTNPHQAELFPLMQLYWIGGGGG